MLTAEMAKREMETGLSAVCAWCEHWHSGKFFDGRAGCLRSGCGGPGGRPPRAFPQYKGPLQGQLASICFICGKDADASVEFHGGKGMIGVCDAHTVILKKLLLMHGGRSPVVSERWVAVPQKQ